MAEVIDTGRPQEDEVQRITDVIMESLGECDLESALTVICGLAGHCVAALAEGSPAGVQRHASSVAESIRKAAIAKLVYDDEQRREKRRASMEEALAVEMKNGH